MHTYNRYPIVWDKGSGVDLYDIEGKKYLDFVSGIAVHALGYENEKWKTAIKDQLDKLTHISNYYYSVPMMQAAENVTKASGGILGYASISPEERKWIDLDMIKDPSGKKYMGVITSYSIHYTKLYDASSVPVSFVPVSFVPVSFVPVSFASVSSAPLSSDIDSSVAEASADVIPSTVMIAFTTTA